MRAFLYPGQIADMEQTLPPLPAFFTRLGLNISSKP